MDLTPNQRQEKQKQSIGLYQIKKKIFWTEKETINKMNKQPTERDKIFANDMSKKGLIFKTYKELIKLYFKNRE